MIRISVIYISIVIAIAGLITGLPMLVWTDETADQLERVANMPLGEIVAPGAAGLGAAEAGGVGAESSAQMSDPQVAPPLSGGVAQTTAALLQGLSAPPTASTEAAPAEGLQAAVAAAVAATSPGVVSVKATPRPKPRPAALPVGEDLAAMIGATGPAQDDLASMSGAALSGLRALRGAAAAPSLDDLVARAVTEGAQDDYMKALQDEAAR